MPLKVGIRGSPLFRTSLCWPCLLFLPRVSTIIQVQRAPCDSLQSLELLAKCHAILTRSEWTIPNWICQCLLVTLINPAKTEALHESRDSILEN